MLCCRNTVTRNSWEPIVSEYETNIKIELIDVHQIKTEPMDTTENIVDDYTASNSIKSSLGKFNCDICLNIFNNYEKLVIHKYFSHKEKPYLCKICNTKFTLSAHLNIHLNDHVDYLYMKESSCRTNIQSSSQSHLEQDLNKLSMSVTSTNNTCNTIVKNRLSECVQNPNVSEPTIPLKSTRTRKSFKCIDCKFLTMSEAKFSHHQQICNQVPTSSKTHKRPNCCKLCHKKFMNQTALNGHMRYHSLRGEIISKRKNTLNNNKHNSQKENGIIKSIINKPIYARETGTKTSARKCKDCNKMFTTHNKLNIHLLQHKKQMICNLCDKQFVLKKNFDKHLLSHNHFKITNNHEELEKSMKCESLGTQTFKKFKRTIANKKKQKLLITIKPYQCSYCKQFYSTERSLEEHITQVHTVSKPPVRSLKLKPTKCNWCDLVITKNNLLRHIQSLHPEIDSVNCSYCSMKFKDFPSMKLHVSLNHKN